MKLDRKHKLKFNHYLAKEKCIVYHSPALKNNNNKKKNQYEKTYNLDKLFPNIAFFIRQIFRLFFSLKGTNLLRRSVFGCHISVFWV